MSIITALWALGILALIFALCWDMPLSASRWMPTRWLNKSMIFYRKLNVVNVVTLAAGLTPKQ